jgi:hypothetical protein
MLVTEASLSESDEVRPAEPVNDAARPPYGGAKRGRKPRAPIAALESGFRDTRSRRPRLTNPAAWRRELRFIYLQTLEGRLPSSEATRLCYIVNVGANLELQAENAEAIKRIEARIASLEGTPQFDMPRLTHQEGASDVIEGECMSTAESNMPVAEAV